MRNLVKPHGRLHPAATLPWTFPELEAVWVWCLGAVLLYICTYELGRHNGIRTREQHFNMHMRGDVIQK
jgi:hypothetical protein